MGISVRWRKAGEENLLPQPCFSRLKVAQLRAIEMNALIGTESRWAFLCSLGWEGVSRSILYSPSSSLSIHLHIFSFTRFKDEDISCHHIDISGDATWWSFSIFPPTSRLPSTDFGEVCWEDEIDDLLAKDQTNFLLTRESKRKLSSRNHHSRRHSIQFAR